MRVVVILASAALAALAAAPVAGRQTSVIKVRSNDGTSITVECTGAGPSLLIVHGSTGDRRRWRPVMERFASRFAVCAMDRRGHGESESGPNYHLEREYEDVAAVANALPGPVAVVGHSYGGLCALEAALLTKKITKLVLYEAPLLDLDHTWVADSMERLVRVGQRDQAFVLFLQKAPMVPAAQIAAMQTQPSWADRVAGVDVQIRELRALGKYRFDAKRFKTLNVPALLLAGGESVSPQHTQAIRSLQETLPKTSVYVFAGEGHYAMDNVPDLFAATVTTFLQSDTKGMRGKNPGKSP